jgi:ribonuclease P protein component
VKVPHHEENVSTEPDQTAPEARISRTNEDSIGSRDFKKATGERAQAPGDQRGFQIIVIGQTGRFGRSDRLLDSRDFDRISREGSRSASAEFVMLMVPRIGEDRSRIGISASRRVGNAVVRNRIKRGIRDWFRRERSGLVENVDLVVIVRPKANRLTGKGRVAEALNQTLARALKQRQRKTTH